MDVEVRRGLLKISEFARAAGVDPMTIFRRIHKKKIRAFKKGGQWRIPANQLLSQPGKKGQ